MYSDPEEALEARKKELKQSVKVHELLLAPCIPPGKPRLEHAQTCSKPCGRQIVLKKNLLKDLELFKLQGVFLYLGNWPYN
jgi:hypothetical protein